MPALVFWWLLAVSVAHAQPVPLYKCVEPSGRVLYTDSPCVNGKRLEIQAGAANPEAIARLEREQALADMRYAERRAAQQREAELDAQSQRRIREHEAVALAAGAQAEAAGQAPGYYWGYGWPGYLGADPYRTPHPRRDGPPRMQRSGKSIPVERAGQQFGRSPGAVAAHRPRGGSR